MWPGQIPSPWINLTQMAQGEMAADRLKLKAPANILTTENTLRGYQESSAGLRASPRSKDRSTLQCANIFGSAELHGTFKATRGAAYQDHSTGLLQVFLFRNPGACCWITGRRILANFISLTSNAGFGQCVYSLHACQNWATVCHRQTIGLMEANSSYFPVQLSQLGSLLQAENQHLSS